MAKKEKKEIIKEEKEEKKEIKTYIKREAKFKPTEWARMKELAPELFIYWENQLMNEKEFEELAKQRRGE